MLGFNPGLIDPSSEFFNSHSEAHHLQSGMVNKITKFPEFFASLLDQEIKADIHADKSLKKKGFNSVEDKRQKFYDCNYSDYDSHPDVTADGQLGPREFVKCSERGNCTEEGKLCKFPCGLTKRQAQILTQIGQSLQDKEICANLFISQDTLRNHKDNIREKTGKEGKIAFAILANQLNLV